MNNNKNDKSSFVQRTLENAADPMSIFQSSVELAKEIVDDLKDTPKTREMKNDINLLIDAINMPIMHNLIDINEQVSAKYPEMIDVSMGRLIHTTREVLENASLERNVRVLVIMIDCIKTLISFDKLGKIAFDITKKTASHFTDAAITTFWEGWK